MGKVSDNEIEQSFNLIKNGVKNIMQSKNFKDYLNFFSRLYDYSFNNTLLIYLQKPTSSYVGSYSFWKKIGRHVKAKEHGIRILAPILTKTSVLVNKLDINGNPIKLSDGSIAKKPEDQYILSGYKYCYVFDISQTDGKPIPQILSRLSSNSSVSDTLINAVTSICKEKKIAVNYTAENMRTLTNGLYNTSTNTIEIRPEMSKDQTCKTLLHEYTHSQLHTGIEKYRSIRNVAEIQAESTAYIVSKHYGLDTSEYSFGYITSYVENTTPKEFDNFMTAMLKPIKDIIYDIDNYLADEYEHYAMQRKSEIKNDIKDAGYIPTYTLVENIFSLDQITNVKNTVADIHKYKENSAYSNNDYTKNLLNNIVNDFKKQETAHKPPENLLSL